MQLPVIVDIAIGLLFIYLILSLLASELQELIATLLQWRAQHLKRSVQMMLAGGSEPRLEGMSRQEMDVDIRRAQDLADRLYNNPLINTLNYEAAGILARAFRRIFNGIYRFFRFNTNITVAKIRSLFQGKEEEVVTDLDAEREKRRNRRPEEKDFLSLFENFRISHNLAMRLFKTSDERDTFAVTTNSINFQGNIDLTDNWSIRIGSFGYDFG